MELLVLVMLYYLSQNPDFERSVKPLLSELKNSEQALKFLEELSQFSKLFSAFGNKKEGSRDESNPKQPSSNDTSNQCKSNASSQQSATAGIADQFIEELLSKYFQSTPKP